MSSIDPGRDALVLPVVRACIAARVPVFGICRGIQEINVALGGSLHYRIHQAAPEKKITADHNAKTSRRKRCFRLNHIVKLTPGGLFQRPDRSGRDDGQLIARTGRRSPGPGTGRRGDVSGRRIEGLRYNDDKQFIVGVQWHAEWQPEKHELSAALYNAFGEAARDVRRSAWRDS